MVVNTIDEERASAVRTILRDREHHRQYYQEHKTEIAEQQHQYHLEHETETVKQHHRYNQEHKEAEAERQQQYHQEHREEDTERGRLYYLRHQAGIAAQQRQYCLEHPEISRNANRKRRALLTGSDGHFTDEEFRLLCEAYESRCIYCKQKLPLVPDHAIPLSKGGSNSIENIVPACKSCNSKKGTKTYDEYMESIRL